MNTGVAAETASSDEQLTADVARNIEQWERHLNPAIRAWEHYALHGRERAAQEPAVPPGLPLALVGPAMWWAALMAPLTAWAAVANGTDRNPEARER